MEGISQKKKLDIGDLNNIPKKKKKNKHLLFGITLIGIILLSFAIIGSFSLLGRISSPTGFGVLGENQSDEFADEFSSVFNETLTITSSGKIELVDIILKLREHDRDNNIIGIASKITELDSEFEKLDVPEINSAWQRVTSCAYETCIPERYINLIQVVVSRDLKNPRNNLINSFIETYNYWDGKNTIHFSKSIDATNSLVQIQDQNIKSKWLQIVECNAACSNFNNLVFEFIELVNS